MKNLVHLQYVGDVPGKPAQDFEIGDKMMWNWGYKSEVLDKIYSSTGKSIDFVIKEEDGKIFTRKMRTTRLVAIG